MVYVNVPTANGEPAIVIVLEAQEAVTPDGSPVAVPIPVAFVVEILMGVKAVPEQITGVDDGAEAVFRLFTVTVVTADVAEHPAPSEKVTLYDPPCSTVMEGVVAPFDQTLPLAAEEVSVTEPPSQKTTGPDAVMVGVVMEPVMFNGEDVDAHAPLVTCTE
jgi:hypothetical protein